MTKQRRTKGSVLEIKLQDNFYAYAQDLDVDMLFFDFFSNAPVEDLTILNDKKPLFFLGVYNDVITSGRWRKVGKLPVKDDYMVVPMKFIQDSINPNVFRIYNPNTGEMLKATREQCLGLECAAVWDSKHVEDRLRDHYYGIPNVWVKQLAIK